MRPAVLIALLLPLAACRKTDDTAHDDSATPAVDADGDGYPEGQDCDEGDPEIHPGAVEVCDGIDNDCDGFVDDADADLADGGTYWPDADNDGYGDAEAETHACEQPDGYETVGGDCDDDDPTINPAKLEECNGIDDDCDGEVDEDGALWSTELFQDDDGDGYGDPEVSREACDPGSGWVDDDADCDDSDAAVHPGANEITAGVDEDCDGLLDEWTPGDAWALLQGEGPGDRAGRALAGAGDQDGDGLADWWAGARGDDDAGADAGAVYLVNGDDGGQRSLADASAKLTGPAGALAGHALDGGRDIDGDGVADLIVGGPYDDGLSTNAGVAWLVSGPFEDGSLEAGVTLSGLYETDLAGWSVALVGDVLGGGRGAVLVGAPYGKQGASSPGVAYLLLEAPSADLVLHDAAVRLYGEAEDDGAGARVAAAGDLDGDGLADLLVGASAANFGGGDSGAAYVWLAHSVGGLAGAVSLAEADGRHHGESSYDMAGYGLAGGGDIDGDGLDDVIVGAPYDDEGGSNAGAAYLIPGPATGFASLSEAPIKLLGARDGDSVGNGVVIGPDADGDGRAEALVGAPVYEADDAGWAAVWSDATAGTFVLSEAPWILQGDAVGDYTGFAVAAPGDMDGDHLGDLLVGTPLDAAMGVEAGAVSVVFAPL